MVNRLVELEDVAEAIEALENRGRNPSGDALLTHLGRGDKRHILKLRDEVLRQREQTKATQAEETRQVLLQQFPVGPDLENAIKQARKVLDELPELMAKALSARFDEDMRTKQLEIRALEQTHVGQCHALEQRISELVGEQGQLKVELEEVQACCAKFRADLKVAEAERNELQARNGALEQENRALAAQLDEARRERVTKAEVEKMLQDALVAPKKAIARSK